ncbi:MAG TPA: Hsp33 family molecular chaperone HslO [Woeseiaceae bacterium]|nr:Hsp33 family molecular chaperone HslO [Woeseiaceae bacterium]
MLNSDTLIPFAFESLPVRGALVQLKKSWQRMLIGHRYRRPVRDILGHAAAASALIAQGLKFDSRITMQLSGNGPLSMLVMQCTSALELRGMAHATVAHDDAGFAELAARANCAITVDGGAVEQPYQGIVEVTGDSLAASLEAYYARSAQIPTHLALVGESSLAGGLLLQQVPEEGGADADDWQRLGLLARTLSARDLAAGAGIPLLAKLFAEDDLRVFRARDVVFRCRCSRQRAADVLRLLGEEDTRAACREQGRVDVTCEYCGRTRCFDEVDLGRVFAGLAPPASDRVH